MDSDFEEYTFYEFCVDRDILKTELPIEPSLELYRGAWDIYGEEYINFCKKNNYNFERL